MNDELQTRASSNANFSRRDFLSFTGLAVAGVALGGCATTGSTAEPIIDIHQHVSYSGRPDEVLLTHQRAMGVTTTILLPSGRPMQTASTHEGVSNGLQAMAS